MYTRLRVRGLSVGAPVLQRPAAPVPRPGLGSARVARRRAATAARPARRRAIVGAALDRAHAHARAAAYLRPAPGADVARRGLLEPYHECDRRAAAAELRADRAPCPAAPAEPAADRGAVQPYHRYGSEAGAVPAGRGVRQRRRGRARRRLRQPRLGSSREPANDGRDPRTAALDCANGRVASQTENREPPFQSSVLGSRFSVLSSLDILEQTYYSRPRCSLLGEGTSWALIFRRLAARCAR